MKPGTVYVWPFPALLLHYGSLKQLAEALGMHYTQLHRLASGVDKIGPIVRERLLVLATRDGIELDIPTDQTVIVSKDENRLTALENRIEALEGALATAIAELQNNDQTIWNETVKTFEEWGKK